MRNFHGTDGDNSQGSGFVNYYGGDGNTRLEKSEIVAQGRATAAWQLGHWLPLASGLKQALSWPLRVLKARRELEMLAAMSEHDLKDIGLSRADVGDVTALSADASPTDFLALRLEERRRARRSERPARPWYQRNSRRRELESSREWRSP